MERRRLQLKHDKRVHTRQLLQQRAARQLQPQAGRAVAHLLHRYGQELGHQARALEDG